MPSVFQVVSFLKFILKARTEHSIHSPFIFAFVTQVLRRKEKRNDILKKLEVFTNRLKIDKRIIEIHDLGAGSLINKKKKRSIADLAKNSSKPKFLLEILYKTSSFYQPKSILELGTSIGLSGIYLKKGQASGQILSIEGCTNTSKIAIENFSKNQLENFEIINQNFDDFLKHLNPNQFFDLIFIDGNHQKNATIKYFNQLKNHINNDSVLIFDDIHWSTEMLEAWNEIKNDPLVKVSVDIYWMGFVFFKKELTNQHFVVRPL